MKAQIQKFVFHFGFLASRFLLGVFASLSFVLFPVRAELQQAEKVRILRGNTGEIDEVQSLTSIDGFENFVNALERAEVGGNFQDCCRPCVIYAAQDITAF